MKDTVESELKKEYRLAAIAEKQIKAYKGVMPQSERKILACNLGKLLTLAKDRGIKKQDIVVDAGIPHNHEAPVNTLNSYCILPEVKSKRKAKARLCAKPKNYLELTLSAANLMHMNRYEAIIMLTEGSNSFSGQEKIDDEIFSPAQSVWELLKAKLAVIVERHQLKKYFRDAHKISAEYGENICSPYSWEQSFTLGGQSTSYWPSVYLAAIIRSSASAQFTIKESMTIVRGEVHAIEQVFLTLGWDPDGWVIGYLEYLPGLAIHSCELKEKKPLFDLYCSGETFTDGRIGGVSFIIDNGGSIKVPDGCLGEWPFRLRSRRRFERITPQQIASTFLDCFLIETPNQNLYNNVDTSAVLSPGGSPLALMEAQLLGRGPIFPKSIVPSFLDKLEDDILFMKNSFQEWRQIQLNLAKMDHVLVSTTAMAELENLRKVYKHKA